jgi:hypothetical protein
LGGIQQIKECQDTLVIITAPLSDEEAEAVAALFPANDDDCYELAWSLIHLLEASQHWPLQQCLQDTGNPLDCTSSTTLFKMTEVIGSGRADFS